MNFWKRLFAKKDTTTTNAAAFAQFAAMRAAQKLADRPPGAATLSPVKVYTEEDLAKLDSFEVLLPSGDGRCSDNSCPCPPPGTPIPHGGGFLYIDPATVEFRRHARTRDALNRKGAVIQEEFRRRGVAIIHDPATYKAILLCEQGARRRGLDLKVAAEDARLAWTEGRAPLRATPRIGS